MRNGGYGFRAPNAPLVSQKCVQTVHFQPTPLVLPSFLPSSSLFLLDWLCSISHPHQCLPHTRTHTRCACGEKKRDGEREVCAALRKRHDKLKKTNKKRPKTEAQLKQTNKHKPQTQNKTTSGSHGAHACKGARDSVVKALESALVHDNLGRVDGRVKVDLGAGQKSLIVELANSNLNQNIFAHGGYYNK